VIPEIGHFALVLAMCLAIAQAIFPLIGTLNNTPSWAGLARPLAWGQAFFLTIAFAALTYAFQVDDFSVRYVASNSNTLLPTVYKISAVWGAHEGSLLLWAFFLGIWGAAIAILSKSLTQEVVSRVLAVMGMINTGFLAFMLFTSNPFERLFRVPAEGRDLNPLLQDIGLALHPPTLYLGYVGFSVAFGFAIAALIGGRLDASWARWSRPWTTAAWVWLTLGITIGSWWAYYELGWGGWWFWDPVENASFMPWIAGTALMHSLAVTEKRGAFRSWTLMLAILAFSLCLLGTFLVRSGVLTSVHAFASDPARGIFILIFLLVVIGGSLALYAWRAPTIFSGGRFNLISRESFLLGNNLLLTVFCFLVLFGTLAPLVYDALEWGKISVGFPWFNKMFLMVTPFLAVLIGFGPLMRWKQTDPAWLMKKLRIAMIISVIIGLIAFIPAISAGSLLVPLGMFLMAWIITSHITAIIDRLKHKQGISHLFADMAGKGRSYYGMMLAHMGVAMFILGAAMVSHHGIEKDLRMSPGESAEISAYRFRFDGVIGTPGPNYTANQGKFTIFLDDKQVAVLEPQKRTYLAQGRPMTEAAIDWGFTRDLYVSLGEPLGDGDWSMRLYYKPFVRWIWLGGLAMALGGVICISDRRYRTKKQKDPQLAQTDAANTLATENS